MQFRQYFRLLELKIRVIAATVITKPGKDLSSSLVVVTPCS
jgi:hypothetical protein